MSDIFNMLKHNNHDVRVIEKDGEILLGCVTCGQTLLTTEYEIYKNDLASSYIACKKEMANNMAVKLLEYTFAISNKEVKNTLSKKIDSFLKEDWLKTYIAINSTINIPEEFEFDRVTYLKNLIHESGRNRDKSFKVLEYGEKYIVSNMEIECSIKNQLLLIDLNKAKEMEKEIPTVKNKFVINNVEDFEEIFPDYDDEEAEAENYNEFVYRIKHDLYDFSNLTKEELQLILKRRLNYIFDGYSEVERLRVAVDKMLELLIK